MQNVTGWDGFDKLPADAQDAAWAQLALEAKNRTDGIAHHEGVIDLPVKRSEPPKRTWMPRPTTPGRALDDIPTLDYVQALTGHEVPIGRFARCPLPDHDDSTPSFKADQHLWVCYGCNRGGRIFDFAAALWGYAPPLRGGTFREIRNRLLDELGIS